MVHPERSARDRADVPRRPQPERSDIRRATLQHMSDFGLAGDPKDSVPCRAEAVETNAICAVWRQLHGVDLRSGRPSRWWAMIAGKWSRTAAAWRPAAPAAPAGPALRPLTACRPLAVVALIGALLFLHTWMSTAHAHHRPRDPVTVSASVPSVSADGVDAFMGQVPAAELPQDTALAGLPCDHPIEHSQCHVLHDDCGALLLAALVLAAAFGFCWGVRPRTWPRPGRRAVSPAVRIHLSACVLRI